MKAKKLLALLLAAVMMLTMFAACGNKESNDDEKDSDKESTTVSTTVEDTTKDANKEDNSDKNNAADEFDLTDLEALSKLELEKLEILQPSGDVWTMSEDGVTMTISAGYCVKTDVVKDVTISMEFPEPVPEHDDTIAQFEQAKSAFEMLNDPEIDCGFIYDDSSNITEFVMSFGGLEESDRAIRVSLLSDFIDINVDENCIVLYSDINSSLIAEGFEG